MGKDLLSYWVGKEQGALDEIFLGCRSSVPARSYWLRADSANYGACHTFHRCLGYYSAKAKPVLTVHSGATVRIQTLSTCGPDERLIEEGVAPSDIPSYNAPIYREVKDKGPGGHILTGPLEIAEAEPGDVLEIQIQNVDIDAS